MFTLSDIYEPITAEPFINNETYIKIKPCEELKPYICCFWGTLNPYARNINFEMKSGLVTPDTCMDIIFDIDINKNKLDNKVENLEWCSVQYNTLYSMPTIIIGQYDLSGNLIATFNHYTEAGNNVGGNKHGVFKCCNNKLKTYKGYVWKKITEEY